MSKRNPKTPQSWWEEPNRNPRGAAGSKFILLKQTRNKAWSVFGRSKRVNRTPAKDGLIIMSNFFGSCEMNPNQKSGLRPKLYKYIYKRTGNIIEFHIIHLNHIANGSYEIAITTYTGSFYDLLNDPDNHALSGTITVKWLDDTMHTLMLSELVNLVDSNWIRIIKPKKYPTDNELSDYFNIRMNGTIDDPRHASIKLSVGNECRLIESELNLIHGNLANEIQAKQANPAAAVNCPNVKAKGTIQ